MAAAGIEFGSHTVDHPVLAHMSEADIRSELVESKRRIEQELGSEVISLSYPVGGSNAFDDRVRRIAAAVGYRCAVSYESGTNSFRNCDWFALRRAHVERYTTMHRFKAEVAIADLLP
jgi:peptidoglycan/xylan/chitin deacetylase (PgdA/CDA1 family)